jgi:hypothetical protein
VDQRPIDTANPGGATSAKALGDARPSLSIGGEDWPARLTDTIVGYVQKVRAATTGRALVASRAVVYLLAAGLIAAVTGVVALIMVFRLLVLLAQGHAWAVYLGIGALFTIAGLFAWAQKERVPQTR